MSHLPIEQQRILDEAQMELARQQQELMESGIDLNQEFQFTIPTTDTYNNYEEYNSNNNNFSNSRYNTAHELMPNNQPAPQQTSSSEEPWFVNSKQFHRIMRRREQRQKLMMEMKKAVKHESRKVHAKKRMRAPGGRFLSNQELVQLKKYGRISEDGHILPRGKEEADPILAKVDYELMTFNKN